MIQFLVHDASHDNVGVAVVDVKAGQELEGRDLVSNKVLKASCGLVGKVPCPAQRGR